MSYWSLFWALFHSPLALPSPPVPRCKKFTTMKQATRFGLFYTLMNVGFAVGAEIADYFRDAYGDTGGTNSSDGIHNIPNHHFHRIPTQHSRLHCHRYHARWCRNDGKRLGVKEEQAENIGLLQMLLDSCATRHWSCIKNCSTRLSQPWVLGPLGMRCTTLRSTLAARCRPIGKYIWSFVAVFAFLAIAGVSYAALSIIGTTAHSTA